MHESYRICRQISLSCPFCSWLSSLCATTRTNAAACFGAADRGHFAIVFAKMGGALYYEPRPFVAHHFSP